MCDGQSILLAHNGSEFAPASEIQARPAHFANLANEGFGSYTSTGECVGGKAEATTRFLWADDGGKGISMRGAQDVRTVDCTDDSDGAGDQGSAQSSNGAKGGSSAGSVIGAIFGVLLAFIAGIASAGPIAQWAKENLGAEFKLPF